MPWVLWNVSKQSVPNNALYSSEKEALDYADRIQEAEALQREEADEYASGELPGPAAQTEAALITALVVLDANI